MRKKREIGVEEAVGKWVGHLPLAGVWIFVNKFHKPLFLPERMGKNMPERNSNYPSPSLCVSACVHVQSPTCSPPRGVAVIFFLLANKDISFYSILWFYLTFLLTPLLLKPSILPSLRRRRRRRWWCRRQGGRGRGGVKKPETPTGEHKHAEARQAHAGALLHWQGQDSGGSFFSETEDIPGLLLRSPFSCEA